MSAHDSTGPLAKYDFSHKLDEYNSIGKADIGRKDGALLASGKAQFTKDYRFPGMLYAKSYRSPITHGKIKNMDTSKAEDLPGVWAVIRYDDPNPFWLEPNDPLAVGVSDRGTVDGFMGDTAHHAGMPVGAVVVAERASICDEAISLIEVEWEELPWALDEEEIAKPGSVILYPDKSPDTNILNTSIQGRGDVEAGFAAADHITEFTIRKQDNAGACVEGTAGISRWYGDHVELWMTTQFPLNAQNALALDPIGVPSAKAHVFSPCHGGAFGSPAQTARVNSHFSVMAVGLSRRIGRPVQFLFEDIPYQLDTLGGLYKYKIGYKDNGEITAVEQTGVIEQGAVAGKIQYDTIIPNIKSVLTYVYRNKMGQYTQRDGAHHCSFMNYAFMRVAEELGKDPTELALMHNGMNGSKEAYEQATAEHGQPGRNSLEECLTAGKAAFGWDEKWHAAGTKKLPNGRMHGVAFSWAEQWSHNPGYGTVLVTLGDDGKVQISGRMEENGQDRESTYARVLADEMGVKYEDIISDHRHNDGSIDLRFPGGSGGVYSNSVAIIDAAHQARQQIFEMATSTGEFTGYFGVFTPGMAVFPGLTAGDLDMKESVIFEKSNPGNKKALKEMMAVFKGYGGAHWFKQGDIAVIGSCPGAFHHDMATRQCHFIEVEVDTDTGQVFITKVLNVNDVGKAINPEAVNGQQYGGSYMGLGVSNFDCMNWDPATGVILNDNLIDYKWPVYEDIGPDMQQIIIETGMGNGPYGLMGTGENIGACTSMMTYMAVHNATGKWVDEMPTTPQVVLKALGKA